ncbi:S-layer homology domain-containing protein [Candidatus Gracilibacteria bacterium]|nr:S-layer homology domain-containing protein [Candidatus Gracilibacteria bacterium]
MNTTLVSRITTAGVITAVASVSLATGVFGTFSSTKIDGQNCGSYGYQAGHGYGYDCTVKTSSTSPRRTGGGGGGGGSSYASSSSSPVAVTKTPDTKKPDTKPTNPSEAPVSGPVLFTNFTAHCKNEVKNLTDARLTSYYDTLKVINKSNTERRLTRAEFLKLVINSAGVDVSKEKNPSYSDVSVSHTLKKYIAYATRNGIVHGQNGKFRPNDTISRAEAAKIFVRGAAIGLSSDVKTFKDVSKSNSLAKYIQTAYDNCILHGRRTWNGNSTVGARVFEPSDGITLAETVKVLYNINM